MELIINQKELDRYRQVYNAIQKQIINDYMSDHGSYMPKEDAQTAAIICLVTKSFTVKNED